MSSSTSSSENDESERTAEWSTAHRRFILWVVSLLAISWLSVALVPWGGILVSKDNHLRIGTALAGDLDYVVLGDSKAGPFTTDCLIPWLPPHRGAVFGADSVTPVYHLDTLRKIRAAAPGFSPKTVFFFVGANNMNENGLHATRDFTYFVQLPLRDAFTFAMEGGRPLTFLEALLSRIFPVYGHRLMITHLQFGGRGARRCSDHDATAFDTHETSFAATTRDPVADRNYQAIYERSMYRDYVTSPIELAAFNAVLELVASWGGEVIIVLPPVTPEIRDLEHRLIGDAFDVSIVEAAERNGVRIMDLRDVWTYEFKDVNHLSKRGAYDLSRDHFLPVLEAH